MAVYRNLQEQVFENAKDIDELKQIVSTDISTEAIKNLIINTLNDYGIKYKDNRLQLDKPTDIGNQVVIRPPVPTTEIVDLVDIFGITNIGRDLYVNGKIQVGNTAITEEQLQKLLQLIA